MSATIDRPLLVVVPGDASPVDWQEGRAEGVTASEIHAIAFGGLGTWKRCLADKLNGATFTGNAHTRRGHEREPFLIQWADDTIGAVRANTALLGHPEHPLHRATPDALGWEHSRGGFGVEVKSHDHGWTSDKIPTDHMDQMQFGMHVTGFDWWLYVWEVMGEDGQPTLAEPSHIWVPRDDTRIAILARQADAFIEWRAAGAPDLDDIPDDVDDALADYARGLALSTEGDRLKAAARKVLDTFAAEQASTEEPLRRTGSRAALFFQPKPDVQVLDEVAWAHHEPESYAEWLALQSRVLETASAAAVLYHRPKPTAPTFRVTPNGAKK